MEKRWAEVLRAFWGHTPVAVLGKAGGKTLRMQHVLWWGRKAIGERCKPLQLCLATCISAAYGSWQEASA